MYGGAQRLTSPEVHERNSHMGWPADLTWYKLLTDCGSSGEVRPMADTSRHTCETFLRGPDVERRAAELISQAHEVRVAVAYWGSGLNDSMPKA